MMTSYIPHPHDGKLSKTLKKVKKEVKNMGSLCKTVMSRDEIILIVKVYKYCPSRISCIPSLIQKLIDIHTFKFVKKNKNVESTVKDANTDIIDEYDNMCYVCYYGYFYMIMDRLNSKLSFYRLPDEYNIWYGPDSYHSEKGCDYNIKRDILDDSSLDDSSLDDSSLDDSSLDDSEDDDLIKYNIGDGTHLIDVPFKYEKHNSIMITDMRDDFDINISII